MPINESVMVKVRSLPQRGRDSGEKVVPRIPIGPRRGTDDRVVGDPEPIAASDAKPVGKLEGRRFA
jgi:hypothetical protein